MTSGNRLTAVLLVAALASSGQAQKSKGAATPEEAVQNLVTAARAGDVDAVLNQMTAPAREMLKVFQGQEDVRKAFAAALDQKFGKDPADRPHRSLKEQLTTLKTMAIASKTEQGKDRMLLKVKSTTVLDGKEQTKEENLLAVKEGDTWKLAPLPPRLDAVEDPQKLVDKELQQARQFAAHYREGTGKVTREIKEGKYKTRKEAMDGYFKAAFPKPPVAPSGAAPKDKSGR